MFNGNPSLRGENESFDYNRKVDKKDPDSPTLLEEFIHCSEDILYFANKYFYIVTVDDGKKKIDLWDFQKKILKAFDCPPDGKQNVIVLASRQISKTTLSTIFILHNILFNKDKTLALLANKEKTAREILSRVKMSYEQLPRWLQQGIIEWNKGNITLTNGSRILAASTSSSAIRGYVINTLFLDEFAFVPMNMQKEFMSSVLPTLSSGKTSKVIVLSTPNGMEMFYSIWQNAVRGQNSYYPIKINWDMIPGRDEAWKQRMIGDLPDGLNQFLVEFGCRFLGTTNILVDPDVLEKIIFKPYNDIKWNGLLKIYENPIEGKQYILGVDTAKGIGANHSVIQVLKINAEKSIEQVAVYRYNKIQPSDFAQVCIGVSDYYNNALIMAENNSDVGGILTHVLWYEYECDRLINLDPNGLGVQSNRKTKLEANLLLKKYTENGWLDLCDKQTIYELGLYKEVTPSCYAADRGDTDDTVTALLWSLYFLITDYYEGRNTDTKRVEDRFKINADKEEDEGPIMIFDD
jgi:hypothetical protein